MEEYTSALQCKKTDFHKLYFVRKPIALLQVEHYKVNTDVQGKKKNHERKLPIALPK